ncbi:hypothetical protein F3I49_18020 [Pantoea sp. M_4]|nr:hypothetical protein F3I49_18020 [Pantoea sp. M_4]
MVIRDKAKQTQDVSALSRDAEGANPGLDKIFDKDKEQRRMETAQLLAEIGSQAGDIARTQGEIAATKAATEKMKNISPDQRKDAEAQWRKANPGQEPTTADITGQVYQTLYNRAMLDSGIGTGGAVQQGISAATAAIQGLAGGNLAQALSGAAAPYLAEQIHTLTTTKGPDGKDVVNVEANLIVHAVVGAVTAYASGNAALAGASGAAMGEYIAQQMYPGVKREDLSEEQRQTISALGTLAAGLAGGIAGDSAGGAVAGAQAGKNALENNSLLLPRPVPVPVPGLPLSPGDKVVLNANNKIASELDKTLKGSGTEADTPPITDGRAIVEARDEAAKSRDPNVAKDLTDAEKAELGGTGSGSVTPPPPENDPKQQNEKPVQKLNQKQESAIRKIDNTIKNALKDHDITGTLKDMDSNPVPKESGGHWDHMQEMQNTLRGLRNHADTLKNLNNSEAQAAYGRATDAINKIESALKGHGI